jgi:hypothetical protein
LIVRFESVFLILTVALPLDVHAVDGHPDGLGNLRVRKLVPVKRLHLHRRNHLLLLRKRVLVDDGRGKSGAAERGRGRRSGDA